MTSFLFFSFLNQGSIASLASMDGTPLVQRQEDNPPPIASRPEVDTTVDLIPKALATTESALRNDPMW
jgi:hypothetical protein